MVFDLKNIITFYEELPVTILKESVSVPSLVHCDHLVTARSEAGEDLQSAIGENMAAGLSYF